MVEAVRDARGSFAAADRLLLVRQKIVRWRDDELEQSELIPPPADVSWRRRAPSSKGRIEFGVCWVCRFLRRIPLIRAEV